MFATRASRRVIRPRSWSADVPSATAHSSIHDWTVGGLDDWRIDQATPKASGTAPNQKAAWSLRRSHQSGGTRAIRRPAGEKPGFRNGKAIRPARPRRISRRCSTRSLFAKQAVFREMASEFAWSPEFYGIYVSPLRRHALLEQGFT